MIINHPLLGPRDVSEFVHFGDASLMARPNPKSESAADEFYRYAYERENPAGLYRELWFHEQGDRSWLIVTRNTLTHEISKVELARDAARATAKAPS